jgi:hypothetical protein
MSPTAPQPLAHQDNPRHVAGEGAATPRTSPWTAAAAMIGVAAGLELAGALARISAGRRRSESAKC